MPANPQDKALVACPQCGHQQSEPRSAISSKCRKCGQYLRIQELLNPVAKAAAPKLDSRRVTCFECSAENEVPAAGQSAMCKRCSSYIDLQDYTINQAVSKNFRTKGSFTIESKGYVFNTQVVARDVVIKGRLIGKVIAERSLTIYSTAEIKGGFQTALLVIPENNCFHCKEPLHVGAGDVHGELVGDIQADATVFVRTKGKLFGNVQAQNLVVEAGAIVVGQMAIRAKANG